MQPFVLILAFAAAFARFGTHAADLVVWWEKGFYEQEDEAVREIVAAFEEKTGKQVELKQPPMTKTTKRRKRRSRPAARRIF